MKRLITICLVIFTMLFSAPAEAVLAVPLSDLLDGATITSGDKLFSDFSGWTSDSTENPVTASDIMVTPYQNPDNLEYGLKFTSDAINLSSTGGLSIAFDFFVTPTLAGYLISDNTLTMTASGGGGVYITETAKDAADETNVLATKINYLQLDGLVQQLSDHQVYTVPVQSVHVYKDISLAWSGGTGSGPQLTEFTQTFSQVPEPATLCLLGLGGIFSVISRKRKTV